MLEGATARAVTVPADRSARRKGGDIDHQGGERHRGAAIARRVRITARTGMDTHVGAPGDDGVGNMSTNVREEIDRTLPYGFTTALLCAGNS